MTSRHVMPCRSTGFLIVPTLPSELKLPRLVLAAAGCDRTESPGLGEVREGSRGQPPPAAPSLYASPHLQCVAYFLRRRGGGSIQPIGSSFSAWLAT